MLHTREFFADCKRALKPGGVLVTQNGLPFLFPEHLQGTTAVFASLFKRVAPYLCTQPCYFGGPFALNLATDDKDVREARRQGSWPSASRKRGVRGPAILDAGGARRRASRCPPTRARWSTRRSRRAASTPNVSGKAQTEAKRSRARPARS